MVVIRNVNEIILSLIDFFQLAQPDLDTKPGTVARDLMIDSQATQLSLLYDQLSSASQLQSLRLVVGTNLDNLAKNFGIVRKQATPATGVALLTFSSLNATIAIDQGDIVTSSNGFAYSVSNGISVTTSSANFYQSVAAKNSAQLAFVGITDPYAVEVTVIATTAGSAGNIGAYSINSTNIPGISNATNVVAFSGGTDQENDAAFRNRVLSAFSGSSVGTQLGYLNTALSTTGVSDAYVAGPGDPLMTRDGSIVENGPNNSLIEVSEGSGGKVDIWILGSTLVQNTDTFIYQDKSNNNDPTSAKNNVVLGQIASETNLTVNQKRVNDLASGVLPAQPVSTILSVTGSVSGGNFAPYSIDSYGRVSGNYQLIKDTGAYAGSPWGFDTFHWVSNQITNFTEALIRGQFDGQDACTFTGVTLVPKIQYPLGITNENSTVTSNNSLIQLLHTPATNVTRVYNVTTGERYVVTNQNFDQTGTYNTTGRIQISGNTLPSPSDGLQVDYTWIVGFDPYSDYDGLYNVNNPRTVTNSVDWGLGNMIQNEEVLFTKETNGNFYQGTSTHPVDSVLTAKMFLEVDGYVQTVASGVYINRLSVQFNNLANATTSVDSVRVKNTTTEVYSTAQANGNVINTTQIVGIQLLNGTTVILPTDTVAQAGQTVTAILNSTDVYEASNGQSSVTGSVITIPSAQIATTANSLILRTTYIALVNNLFSVPTINLPASHVGNGYLLSNNNGFYNFSPVNISRRENQTVQLNTSNQFYIELNLPSTDNSLVATQVISVIRLSDGNELWNSTNPGQVIIGTDGNFQLVFSGFNTPATGDKVLVIYYATDLRRFEPFSYANYLIKTRTDTLVKDPVSGNFTLALNTFINQPAAVEFSIVDPNTSITYFSVTDGYVIPNGATATISSLSKNFDTLADLTNKKVQITGLNLIGVTNDNNSGLYDIVGYNQQTNAITITEMLNYITPDQISVVRVLDGQEVWNYSGTIDPANNRILIPPSPNFNAGDKVYVMFFNYDVLRQGPTRITGTTTDQVTNSGIVAVAGTTIALVQDAIFTVTSTGLKQNVSQALRSALGLSTSAIIPSNYQLVKVLKCEKVVTASPTDNTVLEVTATYDVDNTTLQNNLLYPDDMLANPTLQSMDFILPSTSNNISNVAGAENLPTLGDNLRVSFYYTISNNTENLAYTRNGTLYTNNRFATINRIYISSGFGASQSTKFTATSFTQPPLGARYNVFYNYTAPQQNERIVITYDYNQLVTTATLNIEASRPITADVLAKQGIEVPLDLTMNVVIDPTMLSSTSTILQNVRNALSGALTTTKFGQTIDQITLINVAQGISGIDRARILYFNQDGYQGSILSFPAHNNQFFTSNIITLNTESR